VVVAGKLVGDPIDHGAMPLDERMEGGTIAGRRAGHEVRICRRLGAAAHCQQYDVSAERLVDRIGRG
jgi:hypothetical protein